MKEFVSKTLKNPLFSGSLVMVVGTNAASFINLAYTIVMGKLLGPSGYGDLISVFSLLALLTMVPTSIGLVIVKFVSAAKSESEVDSLMNWFNRMGWWLGLVCVGGILLFGEPIRQFLNLPDMAIVWVAAAAFLFNVITYFYKSMLQGILSFVRTVTIIVVENFAKLGLGIALVLTGFGVTGALAGLMISNVIGVAIGLWWLRKKFKGAEKDAHIWENFLKYVFPVILQNISLTSIYTSDILLVKHFFSPFEAGIYSAVSTLGKIIFFASGPVSVVMFPVVSKKHSMKESYTRVFLGSLGLTLSIIAGMLAIYYFLPTQIMGLIYGSSFLSGASLLFEFGGFMAIYTLVNLFVYFNLSVGKTGVVIIPILGGIAQIAGIVFLHGSLREVVSISLLACLGMLILVGGYTYKNFTSNLAK